MSVHTPVCELLGIEHPIVEAPVAADSRRHLQGSDIAWEAGLRQPGASPAQLIETVKHFAGAEHAIRKALEVLL